MKRNFVYLAVLTLVTVLLVVFATPRGSSPEKSADGDPFLAGVAGQINAVDSVEIVAAGNRTVATMHKTGGHWQLDQLHGYRADWTKLRTLLAALAQARVVETKTDKTGYYGRLGVEDIAAEDAGGVLVRLGIDGQATAVVLGNKAQGRKGQYARLADQAGSVLLDREFDVPEQALEWAESEIIDIGSAEVAEVEIIHPDGERLLVTKIAADQADFDLADIPEGRELKSNWAVNSLGSALSLLTMQTVRPAGDMDWDGAVRMRLLTFSGMEIMADMLTHGGEYLLRLNATHPAAAVAANTPRDGAGDATRQAVEQQAMADVTQAVDDINQRVSGWVYGIEKYKFDAMVKKPEDLLKPLESS